MAQLFKSPLAYLYILLSVLVCVPSWGFEIHQDYQDKDEPSSEEVQRMPPVQLWADVQFPFEYFKAVINPDRCYQNQQTIIDCVLALDAALGWASANIVKNKTLVLLPKGFEPKKSEPEQIETFSNVRVMAFGKTPKEPTVTKKNAFENYEGEKKAERAVWIQLFNSKSQSNPDPAEFKSIMAWISERIIKAHPEYESLVSGMGYGEYLKNFHQDPHEALYSPLQWRAMNEEVEQIFYGVGFQFTKEEGDFVRVIGVNKKGPARSGGVKTGDTIIALDGIDTKPLTQDQSISKIRGPLGSRVTFTIQRKNLSSPLSLTLVRDKIEFHNFESKILNYGLSRIGWVHFQLFLEPDKTCAQLKEIVKGFIDDKVNGVILDLRNNSGGVLNTAVCVANVFLPKGKKVVETRSLNSKKVSVYKTSEDPLFAGPLTVLINDESASASELVAGALRDHQRAKLVGTRTWGKGSVQQVIPSSSIPANNGQKLLKSILGSGPEILAMGEDPDYARLSDRTTVVIKTIARFFQPLGTTNEIVGIRPNLTVYSKPNPSADDIFAIHEGDYFEGALPQLGGEYKFPHPEEDLRLAACAQTQGNASKQFIEDWDEVEGPNQVPPNDYQLLYTTDVMGCMIGAAEMIDKKPLP